MWRTSAGLSALALLAQGLQLALHLFLARRYGAGPQVDAYVAAVTAPQLLVALLVGPSSQLLIPLLVREREAGEGAYARARNALLVAVAGFGAGAAALLALAPQLWLGLVAPGLHGEAARLASGHLRWAAPALVPGALGAYLAQTHAVRGRFAVPAWIAALSSAGLLLGFLSYEAAYGLQALLIGQLVAQSLAATALLVSELGRLPGPLALRHAALRQVASLGLPVLVVAANTRLSAAVDRYFASLLGDGSLALLYYADRWLVLTHTVVAMPLVAVLYTRLARSRPAGDDAGARDTSAALSGTLFAGLPLAAGTWVAAPDLAAVLLAGARRGASPEAMASLALCLRAYVGALALAGTGSLLVRVFYVARDTWTPMCWGGLLPMLANVGLDALVYRRFGVVGLAAVTSLNAILALGALAAILARREPELLGRELARGTLRALAGCTVIVALGAMMTQLLPGNGPGVAALRLAWLGVLSAGGYLAATALLGSPEAREIWGIGRRRAPAPQVRHP